jgi:hypothetical protein
MKRSRLVALLLSLSFTLQLALARDGTTCVMPGDETHASAMSMAGQPAVDMSSMDMSLDVLPGAAPRESSCDHEATATACLVMAPCASGFVAVAATFDDDAAGLPERVVPATIVMPPSPTIPPELPPPRA